MQLGKLEENKVGNTSTRMKEKKCQFDWILFLPPCLTPILQINAAGQEYYPTKLKFRYGTAGSLSQNIYLVHVLISKLFRLAPGITFPLQSAPTTQEFLYRYGSPTLMGKFINYGNVSSSYLDVHTSRKEIDNESAFSQIYQCSES